MKRKFIAVSEKRRDPLVMAHQQLEKEFLIDVADRAMSAESGTGTHGFENIIGVGIGEKIAGDSSTGEPCVTVYVMAKASENQVERAALIPSEVNGVKTDVVAVGEICALPYRGRYRPAPGGVSIGHYKITAGTLGCLVAKSGKRYILSNNHVLANSNNAKLGDPILQPGAYDGGRVPKDTIAKLSQFIRINLGGTVVNFVDCAIALPLKPTWVMPKNIAYGTISRIPAVPARNLLVKKAGRTTQRTRGRVIDVNATVKVNYGPSGVALFRNQIVIVSLTTAPFSAGGDSGSLIMTDSRNRPVGLLFAGSASHTIANPIKLVLAALGAHVAP